MMTCLILCQCAAKHQPVTFSPRFVLKSDSRWTAERVWELQKLEAKPARTEMERLRLLALYEMERRNLDEASSDFMPLKEKIDLLKAELADIRSERQKRWLNMRSRKERTTSARKDPDYSAAFLNRYKSAYDFWNKDDNEKAKAELRKLESDMAFISQLNEAERVKLKNLKFRVFLDLFDFDGAVKSFNELKSIDPCHEKSVEAAFLLSLHVFARGDKSWANRTYLESLKCEAAGRTADDVTREYWKARFAEHERTKALGAYNEVLSARIPGYYFLILMARFQQQVHFSKDALEGRSYLRLPEIEVPSKVDEFFTFTENSLKARLYGDAVRWAHEAAKLLKSDEVTPARVPSLLYNAHLFNAGGYQLGAMQLYAKVTQAVENNHWTEEQAPFDFITEMFPRPFSRQVENLANQWKVDPDFVYSLMRQESAFNPAAVSVARARGLMQMMPFLAEDLAQQWGSQLYYSDDSLNDGWENLKWSIFHLHQLSNQVSHPVLMAASYNAGFRRVRNWWKRTGEYPLDVFVELIPIHETRNYVKLVLRNFLYYKAQHHGGIVSGRVLDFNLPAYKD